MLPGMIRATLPLAAAIALVPALASAKTVTYSKIQTPSKTLKCHALKIEGPGIECKGSFLPDFQPKLDLDPYVQLDTTGVSIYGERRNYTGFKAKTRTLKYGDTWKRAGVTCKLTRSSFRCVNRSKHGFTLTKGKLKRF